MRSYQPIWGADTAYQRECDGRYAPIREIAQRYRRRFSVLDVGANFGWFDFKLASEFDCTCILVDKKPVRDLVKRYGDGRVHWLNHHISGDELLRLSRSEHFDIVLGLSVLHHMREYEAALEGLKGLGSHIFIETANEPTAANPKTHKRIDEMLGGERVVRRFKSHLGGIRPMYLIERDPVLTEQTLDSKVRGAPTYGRYQITSDFESCRIRIDRTRRKSPLKTPIEEREFVPGMNMHNFRLLGGGHPSESWLLSHMQDSHPDNYPWNYVLGHGVIPIDTINKWV